MKSNLREWIRKLAWIKKPAFVQAVLSASKKSWWETISALGYSILGALMPLWGSYFVAKFKTQPITWHDLARHGEFALYAAAFLAPTLHLIINNIRDARRVLGGISFLLGVAGLAVAALMYGTIATTISVPPILSGLNEEYIFRTSVGLLSGSLAFSFFVTLIENHRLTFDPRDVEQESQDELKDRFLKKLEKQDAGQPVD